MIKKPSILYLIHTHGIFFKVRGQRPFKINSIILYNMAYFKELF